MKSATDNIGTFDPGNPDIRFSRGGYKPGDWRKTFTFGKAARGDAEQTNGGLAAGEERRRWEENPVDERIPEWDAPARNPNIAMPFALSSAESVRLVKLLGGTMKKPKAYKDAIGVIDESDEQRIRDDLKAMGFFKGDDFLWAATATPAEVAADRADSQAALDARLEKLGEQRLKGEAGHRLEGVSPLAQGGGLRLPWSSFTTLGAEVHVASTRCHSCRLAQTLRACRPWAGPSSRGRPSPRPWPLSSGGPHPTTPPRLRAG